MLGVAQLIGTSLNALDKPLRPSALVATRLMVLTVPLAWAGSTIAGVPGIFGGVAAANITIGFIALFVVRRQISHVEKSLAQDEGPSPLGGVTDSQLAPSG